MYVLEGMNVTYQAFAEDFFYSPAKLFKKVKAQIILTLPFLSQSSFPFFCLSFPSIFQVFLVESFHVDAIALYTVKPIPLARLSGGVWIQC